MFAFLLKSFTVEGKHISRLVEEYFTAEQQSPIYKPRDGQVDANKFKYSAELLSEVEAECGRGLLDKFGYTHIF